MDTNFNLRNTLLTITQISVKIIATAAFTVFGKYLGLIAGLMGLELLIYPFHWFFVQILADGYVAGYETSITVGAIFGSILLSSLAFYTMERLFKTTRKYLYIIGPSIIITFIIIDIFPQVWATTNLYLHNWAYAIYPSILFILSLIPKLSPSTKIEKNSATPTKQISPSEMDLTKKIIIQLLFTTLTISVFYNIVLAIFVIIWNSPELKPLFNFEEIRLLAMPIGIFFGLIGGLWLTDKIAKTKRKYWKIILPIILFFILTIIFMLVIFDLQTILATVLSVFGTILTIIIAYMLPNTPIKQIKE